MTMTNDTITSVSPSFRIPAKQQNKKITTTVYFEHILLVSLAMEYPTIFANVTGTF